MENQEVFCPVCKSKNERDAVNCKHCGELLEYHPWDSSATTVNTNAVNTISTKIAESNIDDTLIPEDGIAIYAEGSPNPIYLYFDKELVFGRKHEDGFDDTLLDLTKMDGYQLGISRQHAMIRRVETGYEIIDLASTNGSWLNDERLVPNQTYRLASGSQLRFGRMRLLVLYNPVSKRKKTE